MRTMRSITLWRAAALVVLTLALPACADIGTAGGEAPGDATVSGTPQEGAYLTVATQFAALQQAGLGADYQDFARALGAADPEAVVSELQAVFGGGPFDVFTLDATTDARVHSRVAALRASSARLYLSYRLERGAGGWTVTDHELSRDRATVRAHS